MTGSNDLRTMHLQELMRLNRPKARAVPSITGKRADAILVDEYAYGLST